LRIKKTEAGEAKKLGLLYEFRKIPMAARSEVLQPSREIILLHPFSLIIARRFA
jgi:hypothetical protein